MSCCSFRVRAARCVLSLTASPCPAVEIPAFVIPRERPLQKSIAGRVPAQLRLQPLNPGGSPPLGAGALSRPPTPHSLPTARHRVSASALPAGAEDLPGYAVQRRLSDASSSRRSLPQCVPPWHYSPSSAASPTHKHLH